MAKNKRTYRKIRFKILTAVFLLLMGQGMVRAQDRFLPFPFAHTSSLSPSLTGVMSERVRLSLSNFNYRTVLPKQQNRLSDDLLVYRSAFFAADKGFDHKLMQGGIGIRVSTEDFAGLRYNKLHASLAYEVPLGLRMRYSRLRFGVQAGVMQMTLGDDPLTFEDQFQQRGFGGTTAESLSRLTATVPDLSTSLIYYKTQKIKGNPELNYYGGFTLHHLNRPIWGFFANTQDRLGIRSVFWAGARFRTRKPMDYNANLMLYRQGHQNTWGTHLFCRYLFYKGEPLFSEEKLQISVGFNYIHYQSFTPILAIGYLNKYHLAVAYNILTDQADFLPNVMGGLNVGFNYYFSYQKKQLQPDDQPRKREIVVPFPEF